MLIGLNENSLSNALPCFPINMHVDNVFPLEMMALCAAFLYMNYKLLSLIIDYGQTCLILVILKQMG